MRGMVIAAALAAACASGDRDDGSDPQTAGVAEGSTSTGPGPQGSTGADASAGPDASSGSTGSSGGADSTSTGAFVGCGDEEVQAPEECDDGNDINGDGCNRDCRVSGQIVFQETEPGTLGEVEQGRAVAADADGTFYVVGYLAIAAGNTDGWLRKYSAIGGMLWTETHDGLGGINDQHRAVVTDGAGFFYVAGHENLGSAGGGANAFVRKYTDGGDVEWTDSYDGAISNSDVAQGLTLDGEGNLVVVGDETMAVGGRDVLVRKYDPAGNVLWTRDFAGDDGLTDRAHQVQAGADDSLYVVGYETLATEGRNAWLSKWDTDGNMLWVRTVNGAQSLDDQLDGVAVTSDDGVIVCGRESRADYPWDLFLRRYDTDGNTVWTVRSAGGTDEGALCFGVRADADDNLVVAGGENVAGTRDVLIRKYSPDGDEMWTTIVAGDGGATDHALGLGIGADDMIYASGGMDAGVDGRDIWVAVLTP